MGLAFLVAGIGLSVTSGLGVGSWQVLETGLMATTGLSFGAVVLAESLVAILLAWLWLGQRPWIATLVLAFAGLGVNEVLAALTQPSSTAGQVAFLVGAGRFVSPR